MKVVALVSGGKDSCYNMLQCVIEGHTIVALANLYPVEKDELDSYMFQTVGHHAIDLYAEAMGIPLFRHPIKGGSIQIGKDYTVTPSDEVEDLYDLLKEVRDTMCVEAVSVGAILSDYQRVRVENVCARLGLVSLAFLWRRNQEELLSEIIQCEVHSILIKVAALGLTPDEHLGKSLKEIQPHMLKMKKLYGLNECGEGGEYETFTFDCPLFKKRIVIDKMDVITHSDDAFAPVAYLNFLEMHLEEKDVLSYGEAKLLTLPAKRSTTLMKELFPGSDDYKSMEAAHHEEETAMHDKQIIDCFPSKIYASENSSFVRVSNVTCTDGESSDVGISTAGALGKLEAKLAALGLNFSHLTAVHIYVRDMAQFANINSVYKKWFGINPPVRVCVEVCLPEKIPLLLDCVAYKGALQKSTMHVQGLSHWAPANIGPYSQATLVGSSLCVAGQIALSPATMDIISGGIIPQARLSLRHVERVLQAMSPSCSLSCITMGICYVTHPDYIEHAKAEWESAIQSENTTGGHSPLMCYVVVPALPRKVLVEWQITAMTNMLDRNQIERIHRDEKFSVEAVQQIICNEDVCLLKACFSIDTQAEFQVESSTLECFWKKIKGSIKDCASEVQSSELEILSPRVFYVPSQVSASALFESFEKVMSNAAGFGGDQMVSQAPALVPIMGHKHSNTLLSICY